MRYCCISEHVGFRLLLENTLSAMLSFSLFFFLILCWAFCLVYFRSHDWKFPCLLSADDNSIITISHKADTVMPIPSMFFWSRASFRTSFWCKQRHMGPHSLAFSRGFFAGFHSMVCSTFTTKSYYSIGLRLFPVTQYSIASLLKIIMWVFCRLQAVLGIL